MAERSKALVLGTSHYGGASSNLDPVIIRLWLLAAICVDEIKCQETVISFVIKILTKSSGISKCKTSLVKYLHDFSCSIRVNTIH